MEKQNLKSNVVFNIISQVVLYLTPVIIAPYISRVLGAEGVGVYSYGYSIAYYFSICCVFGFSSYGIKKIAANRDNKEKYSASFWMIIITRGINFVIIFTLYVVLISFNIFSSINSRVLLALCPVLIGNFLDPTFLFQGLEKFKTVSLVNIFSNLLYMIVIMTLVKSYDDLILYTLIKSSLQMLCDIILWFFTIPLLCKCKIHFSEFFHVFKAASVFFLPTVITTITPMIDQTMLGYLCDSSEVAYYEQTYKIISLVSALVYAISPVMFSRITYLYKNNNTDECKEKIIQVLHLSSLIVFPAALGLLVIAPYFVPVYLGDDFVPAIKVLQILSIGVMFSPLSSIIINAYFYPVGKVKIAIIIMCISAVLNLVFNIFAIKYLGAIGAAITTVGISIMCFILYIIFSKKFIPFKRFLAKCWKPLLAAVIMFICVIIQNYFYEGYINSDIIICIIDVFSGVLVYGVMLLFLKDSLIRDGLQKLFKRLKHKK